MLKTLEAFTIILYSYVMYRFHSKLTCFSIAIEVTGNSNEKLTFYRFCPFTVIYDSVLFYSTGPNVKKLFTG
jgi:hypothetical protein